MPHSRTDQTGRLVWLDVARGLALVGMAVFHFVFDLEMFGLLPWATSVRPPWSYVSTTVAASFLGLAGMSLVMAHGRGVRWRAGLRRIAVIGGAALLVTAATYASDPGSFVFFGILHAIAAFSLMGLVLMWFGAPGWLCLVLAGGVFFGAPFMVHPAFDHPALLWTGMSPRIPLSVDFEPFFPWAAPFFLGMAVGRSLPAALMQPGVPGNLLTRVLSWAGQRSLLIYLLHQPVLIGGIWVFLALS